MTRRVALGVALAATILIGGCSAAGSPSAVPPAPSFDSDAPTTLVWHREGDV